MTSVGLLFVGSALLLNGLVFIGRLDARSVAIFNVFVGALQVAIPFYVLATSSTPDEILSVAGVFLFGFTYLSVGIASLVGFGNEGIGWYSLWVAILTVGFGLVTIVRFHDTTSGLLWFQWTVLWGLFFAVLALGIERLTAVAGWFTIIAAFTTATIPGFLQLLGTWSSTPAWVVGASIVATALALAVVARRDRAAVGSPAAATPELGLSPGT